MKESREGKQLPIEFWSLNEVKDQHQLLMRKHQETHGEIDWGEADSTITTCFLTLHNHYAHRLTQSLLHNKLPPELLTEEEIDQRTNLVQQLSDDLNIPIQQARSAIARLHITHHQVRFATNL